MLQQDEFEVESIDLMRYIDIAWKRRWLIIVPTVVIAVLAGLWSLMLPKIWEVDALVIPSKFLTQNEAGEFKQILVAEPKQIASQISQGSYNSLIGAELNIDASQFPKISAENLRDTNLVRISVRENDPQEGKSILLSLFNHLKSEFDKKIDVEISTLDNTSEQAKNRILDLNLKIDSQKIDKERTKRDIEADKNKLAIAEDRISKVQEEMMSVKKRVSELDELQRKTMSEKREGAETLALLLYSNEIQQNIRYMNTLEDKVSDERVNIQDLTFSIRSKEQQLLQMDNQISQIQNLLSNAKSEIKLLEEKKNRIDYTQLVKAPTQSLGPVSPNKKKNVMIAGFLGFCISLGIVIMGDIMKTRKKKG